jgi:hypothetical protein
MTDNRTGDMALTWKLVIDSANTSALADFWAEALVATRFSIAATLVAASPASRTGRTRVPTAGLINPGEALCDAGETDQCAFGIKEVTDNESTR